MRVSFSGELWFWRGPSRSAHGVLHCLPGPLQLRPLLANVAAVLAPTGVLFGASILVELETVGSMATFAATYPRARRSAGTTP